MADDYVNYVAQHATQNAITLDEVKVNTRNDTTLTKFIEMTRTGRWHDIDNASADVGAFGAVRDELAVSLFPLLSAQWPGVRAERCSRSMHHPIPQAYPSETHTSACRSPASTPHDQSHTDRPHHTPPHNRRTTHHPPPASAHTDDVCEMKGVSLMQQSLDIAARWTSNNDMQNVKK